LVVVLDVSASMDAQDVTPSRIERARREIEDLTRLLAGDRVGLVLFAGGAYPRIPLTLDYEAIRFSVRDSTTRSLRGQGSDLGAALDEATKLLGPADQADRAILLVSDGEDHQEQALVSAAHAAEQGIRIFAIGVGSTRGAPIPLVEGGFKKDLSGQVVLSRLDETQMLEIVKLGGGAYMRSSAGSVAAQTLYVDEIRGKLTTGSQGVRQEKVWNERFQWPLTLALLLLGAGACLRTRSGTTALRTGGWAGLVVLVAVSGRALADEPHGSDDEPTISQLMTQHSEHPDDLLLGERLGQALFERGEFDHASRVLRDVAERTTDSEQRQRARYDAGLASYYAGRLTNALQNWREVLEENPDHESAGQNAQAVEREIQQRLQPPTPQNDGDSEDSEDRQDGQQSEGGDSDSPQEDSQQSSSSDTGGMPADTADPGRSGSEQDGSPDPVEEGAEIRADGEEGTDTGDETSSSHRPGSISEQEAQRLLDGVEEGRMRTRAGDASRGGKDW
jgi:Ca-activated chloride channel family protein